MHETKTIKRYTQFKTFQEMQEFIKSNWDNMPQPNITGHGYSTEHKHFFEVE